MKRSADAPTVPTRGGDDQQAARSRQVAKRTVIWPSAARAPAAACHCHQPHRATTDDDSCLPTPPVEVAVEGGDQDERRRGTAPARSARERRQPEGEGDQAEDVADHVGPEDVLVEDANASEFSQRPRFTGPLPCGAVAEQALDVLGDDVDLEVDRVARPA